jgi:spoIIIJ-associated protein
LLNLEEKMNSEKTTLEVIAPTVEEAVAKGLIQLGLEREDVRIEVLDPGNRGLFGLGSRHARVRLTIQGGEDQPEFEDDAEEFEEEPELDEVAPAVRPAALSDEDNELDVTRQVVSELLEKMHVRGRITTSYAKPEDDKDSKTILVDIQGDDLSFLIGRRSEVLNALQYITSLIVGKELGSWTPVMVDVQGFRSRREMSLRQMARTMADQAIKSGKRQVLEPMPANERRIIHLELRDHPQVITESIDEEPNRKVTISLKQ